MSDEVELLKYFWNNCARSFAHLTPRKQRTYESIKNLDVFHLKGKTVLDFGGGGGYWGKALFDIFGIKKYIDIDISERNLKFAEETLKGYNAEFYINEGQQFSIYKPDFFLCRAVVHHFPSLEYLNDFLIKVNTSGAKYLNISIKYCTDEDFIFTKDSYKVKKVSNACHVSLNYLNSNLNNYKYIPEWSKVGALKRGQGVTSWKIYQSS